MDEIRTRIDWDGRQNVVVLTINGQDTRIPLDAWLRLGAVRYAAELLKEKLDLGLVA